MQQHTGQHILSQSFGEVLKGETHSFHLAEGISTLEIGLEKVSEEEVEKIELAANAVVFEDREVRTYFVPQERLGDIPLRRPAKKQGTIRVVEISCFDYSACGGTHCRRTGEVGLIKIIRWERIRNHVRFDFLCGGRALSDFVRKNRNLRLLANRLSVNEQDIPAALEKLSVEAKALQKKGRRLEEDLLLYEAREMARSAQGSIIKSFLTDKGPTEGRKLALNLIRQGEFHVLFGLRSEGKVHFVFARSGDRGLDLRELVGLVTSLIPAKGGGSPSLVEIVAEESVDAVDVLDRAAVFLKTRLG
jgi:alanyl-tRNA synthetase